MADGAVAAPAIDSGPLGYRVNRDGLAAYRAATVGPEGGTPRDRLHTIVRALLAEADGSDAFAPADALHVSSSTLDADLPRGRALLAGDTLQLFAKVPASSVTVLLGLLFAAMLAAAGIAKKRAEQG